MVSNILKRNLYLAVSNLESSHGCLKRRGQGHLTDIGLGMLEYMFSLKTVWRSERLQGNKVIGVKGLANNISCKRVDNLL